MASAAEPLRHSRKFSITSLVGSRRGGLLRRHCALLVKHRVCACPRILRGVGALCFCVPTKIGGGCCRVRTFGRGLQLRTWMSCGHRAGLGLLRIAIVQQLVALVPLRLVPRLGGIRLDTLRHDMAAASALTTPERPALPSHVPQLFTTEAHEGGRPGTEMRMGQPATCPWCGSSSLRPPLFRIIFTASDNVSTSYPNNTQHDNECP